GGRSPRRAAAAPRSLRAPPGGDLRLGDQLGLALRHPALLHDLLGPGGREGARGNVAHHGGPGAHVGAVSHAHRRHELRIAADEDVATEHGLVLVLAVVIAGDGSRPDVRVFADVRVADVAEVVRLGALLEARVLRLDEVADTHALA